MNYCGPGECLKVQVAKVFCLNFSFLLVEELEFLSILAGAANGGVRGNWLCAYTVNPWCVRSGIASGRERVLVHGSLCAIIEVMF